jgi:DNA-directed RNA polymerase specialized sigma24 family protein
MERDNDNIYGQDPSWPKFMDLLDSDPEAAITLFGHYVLDRLAANPPRIINTYDPCDHPGLINEVYLHCIKDDFRVLRRYMNQGKLFEAWLHSTAHHKIFDMARKDGLIGERKLVYVDPLESDKTDGMRQHEGEGLSDSLRDLLQKVKDTMAKLDEYCQLLLRMAADGYKIREMVVTLGLPPGEGKKLSDRLRYCRKKLKKLLIRDGIDWSLA